MIRCTMGMTLYMEFPVALSWPRNRHLAERQVVGVIPVRSPRGVRSELYSRFPRAAPVTSDRAAAQERKRRRELGYDE